MVYSKPSETDALGKDTSRDDFYGRDYWFEYLPGKFNYPDLYTRSRNDLSDRVLYWLSYVLKFCLPPGKVLELGSAHGGFVALLRQVGFDAAGLEISPWVVQFAEEHFQIPMYLGPIEEQGIEPGSLDLIVMMDVLEHLPDPLATMEYCLSLLKPDGKLFIQTPEYDGASKYSELVEKDHIFLKQLKPLEHLFLFSRSSIKLFIRKLGLEHLTFLPPCFSYDMFFICSNGPMSKYREKKIEKTLSLSPRSQLVQTLLDLYDKRTEALKELADCEVDRKKRLDLIQSLNMKKLEVEKDREARLKVIQSLELQIQEIKEDRKAKAEKISKLQDQLFVSETDRSLRLEIIEKLDHKVKEIEQERDVHLKSISDLEKQLAELDLDRANRLDLIIKLENKILEIETDREARLKLIKTLEKDKQLLEQDHAARLELINQMDNRLKEVESDRADRLKLIKKLDQKLRESEEDRKSRLVIIQEQKKSLDLLEQEKANFIGNLEEKSGVIQNQLEQLRLLEEELSWTPIRVIRTIRRRVEKKNT